DRLAFADHRLRDRADARRGQPFAPRLLHHGTALLVRHLRERLAAAPDLAELAADEAPEPEPAGLLHVAVEDRADPVGAAHEIGGGVLGLDPAVDDLGDRLAPGLGEPLELGRDVERVVLAPLACPLVDGADAPGELLAVLAQRLDPVGAALEDAGG